MSVFSGPGPFKKGVNDGFFQGYSNVDGIMTLSDSQLMSLGDSLFVSVLAREHENLTTKKKRELSFSTAAVVSMAKILTIFQDARCYSS